jgi:hypothetical protein
LRQAIIFIAIIAGGTYTMLWAIAGLAWLLDIPPGVFAL